MLGSIRGRGSLFEFSHSVFGAGSIASNEEKRVPDIQARFWFSLAYNEVVQ